MPLKEIEFKSSYGMVRLLSPLGVIGESYQIYIDNYFQGMLFTRDDKWHANLNETSKLKPSDIEKLIEIVTSTNQ